MKVVSISAGQPRRVMVLAMLVVLLLTSFLATSRPAEAAAPPAQTTNGVYHIVQPGEYLAKIGREYNVPVQNILWANPNITNWNLIYPGQVIFVPLGPVMPPPPPPQPPPVPDPQPPQPPSQTCRWYHTVVRGETLYSIGRHYAVNLYAIAQANGILNLNLIYAGSTLCIP